MVAGLQRPDLFLVARLLENLEHLGGRSRPTGLQLASAINYTQLERYLAFLDARGLVALSTGENGATWVAITPKGREALLYLARAIRDGLRQEFSRSRTEP